MILMISIVRSQKAKNNAKNVMMGLLYKMKGRLVVM